MKDKNKTHLDEFIFINSLHAILVIIFNGTILNVNTATEQFGYSQLKLYKSGISVFVTRREV